jgi:hypothetical protein
VGNAVTDDIYDTSGQADFAFGMGLVDSDTYRHVKQACKVGRASFAARVEGGRGSTRTAPGFALADKQRQGGGAAPGLLAALRHVLHATCRCCTGIPAAGYWYSCCWYSCCGTSLCLPYTQCLSVAAPLAYCSACRPMGGMCGQTGLVLLPCVIWRTEWALSIHTTYWGSASSHPAAPAHPRSSQQLTQPQPQAPLQLAAAALVSTTGYSGPPGVCSSSSNWRRRQLGRAACGLRSSCVMLWHVLTGGTLLCTTTALKYVLPSTLPRLCRLAGKVSFSGGLDAGLLFACCSVCFLHGRQFGDAAAVGLRAECKCL